MKDTTALSARQRRELADLDRELSGDATLTALVAMLTGPARGDRARPRSGFVTARLCRLAVLAGIVVTAVGIVGATVLGVVAAVAVVIGGTATATGLAVLLTMMASGPRRSASTDGDDSPGA